MDYKRHSRKRSEASRSGGLNVHLNKLMDEFLKDYLKANPKKEEAEALRQKRIKDWKARSKDKLDPVPQRRGKGGKVRKQG